MEHRSRNCHNAAQLAGANPSIAHEMAASQPKNRPENGETPTVEKSPVGKPVAKKTTIEKVANKNGTGQQRGRDGETLAAAFLLSKGARVIARNWRPSRAGLRGEIDLIAQVGEFLCFVEVKTRASDRHGAPQEAVGAAKQKQISHLANAYLSLHALSETPCRFDVIEVWLAPGQPPRLAWIENAFDFRG